MVNFQLLAKFIRTPESGVEDIHVQKQDFVLCLQSPGNRTSMSKKLTTQKRSINV